MPPSDETDPHVTVVVVTRNAAQHLRECLEALRRQSVTNIEIVVVDDCSTDGTAEVVQRPGDPRVVYTRNVRPEGIARSRNRGVEVATGEVVFFTDADCRPIRTWVEEGLRVFGERDCLGVEGRTLPPRHVLTLAGRSVINEDGGQWQTCNIAYRRDILAKVGGFDPRYSVAYEDRDLALRVLRHGEIAFCADMLVFHEVIAWTWRGIVSNALRGRDRVRLIVEHGDREGRWWVLVEPRALAMLLCPLALPLYYPLRSPDDVVAIPMLWVRALLLRAVIWAAAWRARRFLL